MEHNDFFLGILQSLDMIVVVGVLLWFANKSNKLFKAIIDLLEDIREKLHS